MDGTACGMDELKLALLLKFLAQAPEAPIAGQDDEPALDDDARFGLAPRIGQHLRVIVVGIREAGPDTQRVGKGALGFGQATALAQGNGNVIERSRFVGCLPQRLAELGPELRLAVLDRLGLRLEARQGGTRDES